MTAFDIVSNRLCTDPLLLARYPPRHGELLGQDMDSVVRNGDLATISQPLDVLGVNYYVPTGVSAPYDSDWLPFRLVPLREYPRTAMGWPVAPDGLREALVDLRQRYAAASGMTTGSPTSMPTSARLPGRSLTVWT